MRPVPPPPPHRPPHASRRRAVSIPRGGAAVALAACCATLVTGTDARPRDPTTIQVLFARDARAASYPRDSRDFELPDDLDLGWQGRVSGSILHPPIVTADGSLVVASTAGVTELDPKGARVYARALGAAAPVTSPALAPDGSRMVLTSNAELILLAPTGALRAVRRLPLDASSVMPTLVVTTSGTVLIGAPDGVLEVTLEGDVLARISLPVAPVALLDLGDRRLVVTASGDVLQWRVTDSPHELGAFGGPVSGTVTVAADGELVAVVGKTRLVSLDPRDGSQRIRLVAAGYDLPAPPALTKSGETLLLTSAAQILAHDRRGRERMRWSLDGPAPGAESRRPPLRSPPPAPLVGADGRVAVAWPDRAPALLDPDGGVITSRDVSCDRPVALLPVPGPAIALVCGSGLIFRLGGATSPPAGAGD